MSTDIIAFVVVLGVLIFFHELGHFLIAKLFRVGVEKFSLGFGPKLFGKTIGETDYRISAFPLGGYVKMVGEEPGSEIDPEDIPRSFTHKKIYQKMLIVAAGPFFNLLLAVLIFFALFSISGVYDHKPSIGEVSEGSPAEVQGLKKGDLVLSIDQKPVSTWDEMAQIITHSGGRPLHFEVSRGDSVIDIEITPELSPSQDLFGEDVQRYMIGVADGGDYVARDIGVGGAFLEGVRTTYSVTKLTVISFAKIIQGRVSPKKAIGGPIMIAQIAGQQARAGMENFLFFIALLSISLSVINFLPIPVLDGGHLLFFTIEAVIRRPLNTRMREVAQQIGIFILVFLMIFVFYNDIHRLIFS